MPTSLSACAKLLAAAGVRHHVDIEDTVIRLVFRTRHYVNPRGEQLAVMKLEAPDEGRRLRASIVRAFPVDNDLAAACLACCRLAADTPLVGVEYDAEHEGLRLVAETVVEDGRLTKRQVLAMIERVVAAAEAWHMALRAAARRTPIDPVPGERVAAGRGAA